MKTILKLEVPFLISPKLSIKFSTKLSFLDQTKVGWQVTYPIIINFVKERKRRIANNFCRGTTEFNLKPLLFLIYINDLFHSLIADTSLFSVVHDRSQSGINLNDYLKKISNWAFQWKVSFNPVINKQAQVTFPLKLQKSNHTSFTFSGTSVTESGIKKTRKTFLDSKLDFKEHTENAVDNVSKKIDLLRKLQSIYQNPV